MSDIEEPRFNSLADRIKALNQNQALASPSAVPAGRRPPPPPPPTVQNKVAESVEQPLPSAPTQSSPAPVSRPVLPQLPSRPNRPATKPPPLPRRVHSIPASLALVSTSASAPPPLPIRQTPPAFDAQVTRSILPPRPLTSTSHSSSSSQSPSLNHRSSTSSDRSLSSQYSMATSVETKMGGRKLPPAFGTVALPPLPPSRREREAETRSAPTTAFVVASGKKPAPSLPPRQPKVKVPEYVAVISETPAPVLQTRRLPPPAAPKQAPLPAKSTRPGHAVNLTQKGSEDTPPPIPIASKPTQASIDASKRRLENIVQTLGCLHCRDFSKPDHVAAQYPRQSLPAHDAIGYLAQVLCSPFPSPTDKARAIFTWHHHNIDYDWAAFSSGCVRLMTPDDVIREGKGVCAGYADCFEAIARCAGLQCIVISGHGKGIGHVDLEPGQPVPRENATGHAWNAVQIDNGEWKLIDVCWGAGSVSNNRYQRGFSPQYFCASNEVFGLRHFPRDKAHFLRADGRTPSWAEYLLGPSNGPAPLLFADFSKEDLSPISVSPAGRDINAADTEPVRIQFSRVCAHGRPESKLCQDQRAYLLKVDGEWIAMNSDGFWWWMDVSPKKLGNAGESFMVAVPTQLNGRAVSELTVGEYENRGCVSIAFSGLVQWKLV
ncbi:hypothetical protein Cpir12675_000110 [Ceratocystis pirilliformis]|uniref:Transglutaminase-like domain-containing protein n=1 Tax=Ceratocystis pirilliformis TaxID=259994 RepID=A0ABR3ZP76_9PEZI